MRHALTLVLVLLLPLAGAAAESHRDKVMRRLKPTFMFGVFNEPFNPWIPETRKQGATWDIRYKYIAGGVNTKDAWAFGGQKPEVLLPMYLEETASFNCIPSFTWYMMYPSLPGIPGNNDWRREAEVNRVNSTNVATMTAYFTEVRRFMTLSAKHGKTVILHVEPDLWGYFSRWKEFAPNDPEKTHVVVKSTGLPELAGLTDTVSGFGRAFVAMRDAHAPNVLLAWAPSVWGDVTVEEMARIYLTCGQWDLVYMSPSDRDAAWRVAKNYLAEDAWWTDADFAKYRAWCGGFAKTTGLPIMLWQIPNGNTIKAACNNTDGHWMDNRPEHFLEDYPRNQHIAEWRDAGVVGVLFGQGAGGCTRIDDAKKDGVTNPPPIPGNRGEQATFPDDDGGYLRERIIAYYRQPLTIAPPKVAAKPKPKPVAPAQPKPAPAVDTAAIAAFDARLRASAGAEIAAGREPAFACRLGRSAVPVRLAAIASGGAVTLVLTAEPDKPRIDLPWASFGVADRRALANVLRRDNDADSQCVAAFYALLAGDRGAGEELLRRGGDGAATVRAAFPGL